MYPSLDVQTALTLARLHQHDVRASYPRRGRALNWLRHRTEAPATPLTLPSPTQGPTRHHPAAA